MLVLNRLPINWKNAVWRERRNRRCSSKSWSKRSPLRVSKMLIRRGGDAQTKYNRFLDMVSKLEEAGVDTTGRKQLLGRGAGASLVHRFLLDKKRSPVKQSKVEVSQPRYHNGLLKSVVDGILSLIIFCFKSIAS